MHDQYLNPFSIQSFMMPNAELTINVQVWVRSCGPMEWPSSRCWVLPGSFATWGRSRYERCFVPSKVQVNVA